MADAVDERMMEKRRRILDAARILVLRHGLRGTTMEAIARAAQIAKPTLYAQFADKDAVFTGIVDTMMDELLAAYDRGMQGPGDIAERIGNALAGQFASLARSLEGSPHAAEIMSEHRRAGIRVRDTDLRAQAEIAAALQAAGTEDPAMLAKVICAAAYGIALKTPDEAAMTAAIKLLCRKLIG
ncbi:TetR/AcrR family transcriptional regulator [Devosia beringensis]|uniref:TetR/AcrR family transcriptional regulator n=1 Tax=Devosia beringensis TaxID=2657486 RepID=UPI00186BA81A|nr:TetR/AcrR family transcriptional regulator [Devosia beringensis]